MSWKNEIDGVNILNAHLQTENAKRATPYPIAWENLGLEPLSKPYLRVYTLYGENRGKTLAGKEELDAVYQVDLVTKAGGGNPVEALGEVRGWFEAGRCLIGTGGYVRVGRTSIGPKIVDGDGFFLPLSITVKIQEDG
jgi:hypothetical protein